METEKNSKSLTDKNEGIITCPRRHWSLYPDQFFWLLIGPRHRNRHVTCVNGQWGLSTKWRRSGSAGHFCTQVHASCMAGCVRPRKMHLRRATFCSFCLNTLRVILTDDLCVWKIKPQKELEQDLSIFSDRWQWAVWDSRTTFNTAERLVQWHGLRLSAANDAFAWVLFSSVFPTERVPHLAFWLFWFCVCGHWLLSPSHGHLTSARSG